MLKHKMAEIEKEKVESPVCHPVTRGVKHRVAAPYFNSLYTLFSFIKEIKQSCGFVRVSGLTLPRSEQIQSLAI